MTPVTAGLLAALLAAPLGAQEADPAKWLEELKNKFPPADRNVAAEEMERLALALGIDWNSQSAAPEDHPAKEDLAAYRGAQIGSWLDAQIKTSEDSISAASPKLAEFLQTRGPVISRLVGVLQRDVPDWGFRLTDDTKPPPFLLVVWLQRVLLADALVKEHSGSPREAGQLLEASWSLSRSLSSRPELISQLLAISIAKLQIGVVRRMSEPSFDWLDRMSGEEPWDRAIDAMENGPLIMTANHGPKPPGQFEDLWVRGLRAAGENLRDFSACRAAKLTVDELWEPVLEQLEHWKEEGVDTVRGAGVFKEISAENLLQIVRRVARLRIDRELTAKILELRGEKAASRDRRWPSRFLDIGSEACPEGSYEYQLRGRGMSIRFRGDIEDPAAPSLVLPLSFEARAVAPTPTPTLSPRRPTARPRS